MSKKENSKQENNIENVIENTFSHIKDIVDANTVVGNIIKINDKNYMIPVSKISVGLISGGGSIPKGKNQNQNMGSGTGFNIVPIGFVAVTQMGMKFLPVNQVSDISKSLIDLAFKMYEIFVQKDEENRNEKNKN